MNRLLCVVCLVVASLFASSASALTVPDFGESFFVGTTEELWKIRAAISVLDCEDHPLIQMCSEVGVIWTCQNVTNPSCLAVLPGDSHSFLGYKPWSMGAIDCMEAAIWSTAPYLGRTAMVNGEPVTVPVIENIATQANWPGECMGYRFFYYCSVEIGAPEMCADPE